MPVIRDGSNDAIDVFVLQQFLVPAGGRQVKVDDFLRQSVAAIANA